MIEDKELQMIYSKKTSNRQMVLTSLLQQVCLLHGVMLLIIMNHKDQIYIDEGVRRDINTLNIKNVTVRWCLYALSNA